MSLSPKQQRVLRAANRIGRVPVLGKAVAAGTSSVVGKVAGKKASEECLRQAKARPELLRGHSAEDFCKEIGGLAKGVAKEATKKQMTTKRGQEIILGGGVHRRPYDVVCDDLGSGAISTSDLIALARLLRMDPEQFQSKASLCTAVNQVLTQIRSIVLKG